MSEGWQAPISQRKASTYGEFLAIVTHPAFRLGFLDAQHGRPLDHDKIVDRIQSETPRGALRRLGWDGSLFSSAEVEVAQYRYEEGRLATLYYGLRCKAWGHPDFPPAAVRRFIEEQAKAAPTPPGAVGTPAAGSGT